MRKSFFEKNFFLKQDGVNGPFLDPKSTLLDFSEIVPKRGKGSFFSSKSTLLNFFSNLVIGFFKNCVWWRLLQSSLKKRLLQSSLKNLFWFLRKIIFMPKMGVNGAFLGPKSTFSKFSLDLLFRFFRNSS